MSNVDAFVCRRSPHLVCYWRPSGLVIENYATGIRASAPALTCEILDWFSTWRSVGSVLDSRPIRSRRRLRQAVTRLIRHSLLQRADREPSPRERAMDQWTPWNPSAGFFHTTTKDVAFVDMDTQLRSLRAQARTNPMPAAVKRYATRRVVRLPRYERTGEFTRVLLGRRTWRRFARKPIGIVDFSVLLDLTAGIQCWAGARGEGRVALKTSPSGGARHAIELYTLALRVDGLRPGLYHYAADIHALELVDQRTSARRIHQYLPNQPWYKQASALILFTAVFPRELWRYSYARAYRAVLIEAGHLCQTLCLTATWLGLAPFCTMALADSAIEHDLRIDGITESVLYAAGVGTRPSDAEWRLSMSGPERRTLSRRDVIGFPGRIVASKGV
jgi:SagB-type dehydrogenase family enzyme